MDSSTTPARRHRTVTPSIPCSGTPVVLLTTENPDGTAHLAPVPAVGALGRTVVLGTGRDSRTAHHLADRRTG
ncbi:pyridoxamine 5'-phosphate oxidase family protein [Streptomyces sp. Act-28]